MTLFAILLLLATPGEAPAARQEPTQASASEKKEKLICRREQRPNSRFQTKVCRTQAERRKAEKDAEDFARETFTKPARALDERP